MEEDAYEYRAIESASAADLGLLLQALGREGWEPVLGWGVSIAGDGRPVRILHLVVLRRKAQAPTS
jgi:hypothetical protein